MALPRGSKVVPFGGSYIESQKGIPKKELLWSLWVRTRFEVCGNGLWGRLGDVKSATKHLLFLQKDAKLLDSGLDFVQSCFPCAGFGIVSCASSCALRC